jgi:hypothetical protein
MENVIVVDKLMSLLKKAKTDNDQLAALLLVYYFTIILISDKG